MGATKAEYINEMDQRHQELKQRLVEQQLVKPELKRVQVALLPSGDKLLVEKQEQDGKAG